MNFVEDIMNDKNVDLNDLNLHYFIMKSICHDNGHDCYDLTYGDPRLTIPLLVAMKDIDKSRDMCKKVYRSDSYQKIINKIRNRPALNTRSEYHAESLEALQNKLDKGQPNWKRGNPHVIDISKLEVYDLNDPDVIKKACES